MITILKNIALFQGLEDTDLKKICEVVKEVSAPKGKILFKAGDKGDAFYLIKSGSVDVLKEEDGAEKVVHTLKHADASNFFGEMALIEDAPRNATIRTAEDCELLSIAKTDFDMMLRLNSFIALRIMTALSKRFRSETAEKQADVKLGKVMTVFSPKSGAGKTVFAANLAAGLAKVAKERVLLVDLDLQFGDLAFMLGLNPKRTIADLVDNPTKNFDVMKEYLAEHSLGFSVLPSPVKPEQSEMINSGHLKSILEVARQHFDYIILDTHSLFQDLTINAMDQADFIFLMMIPNMNHIKSMHICLKVMENLKYPTEHIKLVLNRQGSQFSRSKDEIEGGLKRKVDYSLRDNYKQVSELVDHQKTIFEANAEAEYRSDMLRLMEKVTGKELAEEAKGIMSTLKGWFGS